LRRGTQARIGRYLLIVNPAEEADAGATWLVLTAMGDDWHAQWELIAEAATLLD
jgi:hypothetical protein